MSQVSPEDQGLISFNLYTGHLGILLKYRYKFRADAKKALKAPGDAEAVDRAIALNSEDVKWKCRTTFRWRNRLAEGYTGVTGGTKTPPPSLVLHDSARPCLPLSLLRYSNSTQSGLGMRIT